MEFVLIIIVVVIVSIISAATKKKPKSSGESDAPVRPTMSDIQRAFMMAANAPDERPQQIQPQAIPQGQPMVVSYASPGQPYERPAAVSVVPAVAESYAGISDQNAVKPMALESVSPFAGVQLGPYFMDEAEPEKSTPAQKTPTPQAAHLALFENQQDIVKAFVYAEILPRRGQTPRFR
jgi:hypothetical protein